jgi:tetratricopeptide (TPR) repeat protein
MESASAIDLYERALALAPPEDGWGDREARVLCGIGEAAYWLGSFDRARDVLGRALRIVPEGDWARSVAHRFLGDIALNIDGDLDAAAGHFERALEASRRLPEDHAHFAVVRTLLMSGWVPYMRYQFDSALGVFEEALRAARANPEGDPWGEARALTFVANVKMATARMDEYLPLLEEAMAIGRRINDPFSTAVATQHYANALSAGGRLDEAIPHARAAAATFAELGARWETASALGDLGEIERVAGRVLDAEGHLREAAETCRELGDRQLIGWVSAELALALRALGRDREARALLEEAAAVVDLDEEPSALRARARLAVADGDRSGAEAAVARLLELIRQGNRPNAVARAVWLAARLLGPEVAGGEEAVRAARDRLERIGWKGWLEEKL